MAKMKNLETSLENMQSSVRKSREIISKLEKELSIINKELNNNQEERDLIFLLDEIKKNRSINLKTYEEYLILTEFLFLHDNDFKVCNINGDKCTIQLS